MNRCRFASLYLVLILLTACNGAPGAQATPDAQVTVTFMTWPAEPPGLWKELITAFEKDNPTIHIEPYYQEIPADWPRQADVALGPGLVWYQEIVDQGWLLDLTPLIEADHEFEADDFYPGVLALFQQEGHTWAIPIGEIFDVLVYSPALFQEAGVLLPGPDWTVVDLFEAARRIAESSPDKMQYSFLERADAQLFAYDWIAERSGGLYRQQGNSVRPDLDRPEVRQAVSDYLSMIDQVTALSSGPRTMAPEEILTRIAQGEVGMATMPLYSIVNHLDQYPGLAIAPLPPGDMIAQRAVRSCDELAISAGTAQPQAAWRWVRFLSRQNLGRHLPGGLPARRSVTESSGAWDQLRPEAAAVVRASLENQAGRLHLTLDYDVGFVHEALGMALFYIQEEQAEIGAALANAQQQALTDIRARQEEKASATPVPFRVAPPLPATETALEFQVVADEQLYRAAVEAFEAEHPGWRVRISAMGTALPQSCLATYMDGNALTAVPTWDLLARLDPLAEADRQFSPDEFWPQALAAVIWQNRLYGVPGSVKPLVLYYNPVVFERAGLAPPTPDWTVSDLLLAGEQIAASEGGDFGYLPQVQEIPFLLEQQGVSLFTQDHPPLPRFTDPQVSQSLETLSRLGGGQVSFPYSFSTVASLINGDRIGMWFNIANYWSPDIWPTDTSVTAIRLRPGTPLPMQVRVFGLAASGSDSQQSRLCWEWINFLARQGVCAPDELPALRRLAEGKATQQDSDAELFAAYTEMLRHSEQAPTRDTVIEDWAAWWFLQALREARTGDLETALRTAQNKAEAFVSCLGPMGDKDLHHAQTCAQQTDPDHPLARLAP